MIKILSLTLSLILFLIVIWIIVPAPAYFIWLVSVAASEWNLWFGIISLSVMICSLCFAVFGEGGKIWTASLIISFAVFVISLYPLISVLKLANEQQVSLSLREYFSGLHFVTSNETLQTYTFATVEGKDFRLDVYTPQVENENTGAAVIVVHGGGWNARRRSDFPQWNQKLNHLRIDRVLEYARYSHL